MARPHLRTHVWLDRLRCIQEGDGLGDSEPYLWTALFKIDGETVFLGDDLKLHGHCTFVPTPGSHGNLDDSDVGDGDVVPIPPRIGEFDTTVVPIPVPDHLKPIVGDVAGVVGVVTVLMEENQVLGSAAEAGHRALDRFLEDAINGIIPTLGAENREVSEEQLEQLTEDAREAIKDAIVDAQGVVRNILSFIDGDVNIGAKVFTFDQDEIDLTRLDLHARMQRIVNVPRQGGPPVPTVVQDYELFGHAHGVPTNLRFLQDLHRSAELGAPAATGSPTGIVVPHLGVYDLIYREPSGHLRELWRDSANGIGTTNLTANAGAPVAVDDPMAFVETSTGMVIVIYRSAGNRVRSLYWSTGAVGSDDLSGSAGAPAAAGRPFGYFGSARNVNHVVYRTTENRLHVLWWTPVDPVSHSDLTGQTGAPRPAGDPVAYVDTLRLENIVVFRGTDRHIHSIYWLDGPAGHDNLSGFTDAPLAAGDPHAYYRAGDDSHQVVYRGDDGRLHEIWWAQGSVAHHWDLSTPAGAPRAAGDPTSYYSAGTNTKHVVYRSADGHLHEIWWVPGGGVPAHVDLTLLGLARLATGEPGAFTVEGPNTQHVVYRGTDGEIHEIRWGGALLPEVGLAATSLEVSR